MIKFKSLKDQLENATREHLLRLDRIYKDERIAKFIRTLPLIRNESVEGYGQYSDTFSWAKRLSVLVRHVPPEMVTEMVLGPIHREFGVDWTMSVDSSDIDYTTVIEGTKVQVSIRHVDNPFCEIKQRVKRVLSDDELEEFRAEYTYELNCEGEQQ